MKDDLSFKQSKRLSHTRQHWNLMTELSKWSINDAGGRDKVFGTKPGVSDYTPTDLGTEAGKAARGNLANMPDIMALLEKIMPGYGEMLKQGGMTTNSLLRGEIPQDVQDQVRRSSAFKALGGGYGGSGMSRALTARDLGRTSLDMTQLGANAAQRWAALAQGSVAPWMTTGAQQGDMTMRNNLYQQATQQQKFNVLAAPDPGAAGQFNLQNALGSQAMSFGMGSAMGSMGGGQRTQQQQPAPSYSSNPYQGINWQNPWGG